MEAKAETPAAETPATADATDGGWLSESASAPIIETPADTTARVAGTPADKAPAPAVAAADGGDDAGDDPAPAVAATDATKPAKPAKKGTTLADRRQALVKEVDTLTYRKHETDREFQATQKRLADAKAELAAIEAKKGAAVPASTPGTAPAKPAAGTRPTHPRWRDFETDDAYDKAVAEWQTKDAAWLDDRDRALEARVTGGLDDKIQRDKAEAAAKAADDQLIGRLDKARKEHPDWAEKSEALKDLRSGWYNPAVHPQGIPTPFLSDIGMNAPDGPEFLYRLGTLATEEPDRAQRLADLLPTKELRAAILYAPSPATLMEHFSTEQGAKDFEELKAMHPVRLYQAVGALSVRLEAAPSGSASTALHPITQATPSAKPPMGTPRTGSPSATGTGKAPVFDEWMKAEDAREKSERLKAAGIRA